MKENVPTEAILPAGYSVERFQPDDILPVAELLKILLGDDAGDNLAYFRWKYYQSPLASECPMGMVVRHRGKVVGFRGYLASRWRIPGRDEETRILSTSDTCIDPDHRRKGLSTAMGIKAMEEFCGEHLFFLNLSSNSASQHGYLKLGFFPLMNRTHWAGYSLPGLVRYALKSKGWLKGGPRVLDPGSEGNLAVSDKPDPRRMSSVINSREPDFTALYMVQDEAFFRWRYRPEKKKYLFYYRVVDGVTTGYLVIFVTSGNQRGIIVDHAASNRRELSELLNSVFRRGHFELYSIPGYDRDDYVRPHLEDRGFRERLFLRKLDFRQWKSLSVLLRPVKREFQEEDFLFGGLDLRRGDSWRIKGICSDAFH
jgi:GNAT superfamily N-acetyltransferase